jgi:hypothetical protein
MLSYAAGCGARAVIADKDFLSEDQSAPVCIVEDARATLRRARSLFALFGNSSCDGFPWAKSREEMSAITSFELCHTMDSAAHIMAKLESPAHFVEISTAGAHLVLKHGLACAFYFDRHLDLDGQAPPRTAAGFIAHMEMSIQTWAIVYGLDMDKVRGKVSHLDEDELFKLMSRCERVTPVKSSALDLTDVHDFYIAGGLDFQMISQSTLVHDSGLRILGKPILARVSKMEDGDFPVLAIRSILFTLPPVGSPERAAALEWILEEQGCCVDYVKIQLADSGDQTQCVVRAKVEWPIEPDGIPSLQGFVDFLGLLLDRGGEFGLNQAA